MRSARDLRVCVVGAGPAGLSAADELRSLGLARVTVLERAERVGGKCRTVEIDGETVETGAVYVLPNYPTVAELTRRTGVRRVPAARIVHVGNDGRRRPFGEPARPVSLASKLAEYARLGRELAAHYQVLLRPFGEASRDQVRDLALPFARWIDEHRLSYFQEVAYPLLRSFGFGFEEQEIPALYIVRVLPQLAPGGNFAALWSPGSVELHHLREGYGGLFRCVAEGLDVRVGTTVESIQRTGSAVRVRTAAGTTEFDRLILACPLDEALSFLDASPEETSLFGQTRWLHVWQAAARVDGIGGALLLDRNQSFSRIGRLMILARLTRESNMYYLFGYATESMSVDSIEAGIEEDIASLGGRLVGRPVTRRWKYFPHFPSDAVAAGCYEELEGLQGKKNTYYAGELVANIGVESVAWHARHLVQKAFGEPRD
jgi:hypothetical protein